MKLTKQQIQQQREAIDGLYELVKEAPASERKDSAMAYCEGCVAACDLALKILNGKKAEDAPKAEDTPKAEDAPKVEEQATTEEKPKRKRVSKKKEAPVEETLPVEEDTVVEETLEDDDLDDLL